MKTVFNTSEIAHIWAKQSQEKGRVSAGNIYFNKTEIYSYGSHFCMGRILGNGKVLLTDRSYSNTTAKHLRHTRQAVSHLERIYVPHPETYSLRDNLKVWKNRIESNLSIISNTRKRPQTKEAAKGSLLNIVSSVDKYLEVTGQSLSKKWALDDSDRKEFILFYEAAKSEQASAQLAAKLEKRAKLDDQILKRKVLARDKEQAQYCERWIAGENVSTYYFEAVSSVHLRLLDNFVQTSKGATVSLQAAKLLFKTIQAGKDVKGFKVDGYTVISLNGVLTIGCHKIERKEINRFAALQGWGQIEETH